MTSKRTRIGRLVAAAGIGAALLTAPALAATGAGTMITSAGVIATTPAPGPADAPFGQPAQDQQLANQVPGNPTGSNGDIDAAR